MNDNQLNSAAPDPASDLFSRIAQGDEQAFKEAHELFKTRLFFYAKRFRLEWHEVSDVVAEAFLGLWNGRTQLQSNDHLKNFLYFAVRKTADSLKAAYFTKTAEERKDSAWSKAVAKVMHDSQAGYDSVSRVFIAQYPHSYIALRTLDKKLDALFSK